MLQGNGNNAVCAKNSQVSEQRLRIESLVGKLSERIIDLDKRFSSCLRQEPKVSQDNCNKQPTLRVELAQWLTNIGDALEVIVMAIDDIINRCEL